MLRAARLGEAIERRSGRDVALDVYTTGLLSLVDAEYVCALDLDMDVFLPTLEPFADAVADEWLDAFARMRGVGAHLASHPDHSSPINAGFMLLRPNRSLYEEGVRLLARADRAWSVDAGWDLLGRPLDVVPRTDVVLLATGGRRHAMAQWVSNGKWDFVGAMLDQGFFFHMYRVRRSWPYGIDERCLPPVTASEGVARASANARVSASAALMAGAEPKQRRQWRYRLAHMFNKPFRSNLCGMLAKPPALDTKGRRDAIYAHKASSWHAGLVQAFGGRNADEPSLMPAQLRARCAAASAQQVACARTRLKQLGGRWAEIAYSMLPLDRAYSTPAIFAYTTSGCPKLVVGAA
ncbi:hypothetical protein KFE25_003633 [Diacronema lutheri]|uniref:Uncharacterized protein n=1 Tax=Diacronema lutheri TaxID=2081491 RepID=A0A8J6C5G7_DIALT|nr:hypothetical protein KFE25_003633 [Diacronema lutheri]